MAIRAFLTIICDRVLKYYEKNVKNCLARMGVCYNNFTRYRAYFQWKRLYFIATAGIGNICGARAAQLSKYKRMVL